MCGGLRIISRLAIVSGCLLVLQVLLHVVVGGWGWRGGGLLAFTELSEDVYYFGECVRFASLFVDVGVCMLCLKTCVSLAGRFTCFSGLSQDVC